MQRWVQAGLVDRVPAAQELRQVTASIDINASNQGTGRCRCLKRSIGSAALWRGRYPGL